MLAQLAQFSSLEQMQQMNTTLTIDFRLLHSSEGRDRADRLDPVDHATTTP